jgi:hypothetical protein
LLNRTTPSVADIGSQDQGDADRRIDGSRSISNLFSALSLPTVSAESR